MVGRYAEAWKASEVMDKGTAMANQEHVEIVRQGADAIAKWQKKHPDQRLDLRRADLEGADLRGATLRNLSK
jgi:uncharacterized protein YjbI with pentapeptide repeats